MAILPECQMLNNNSEAFKQKQQEKLQAKIVGKAPDDGNTKNAKIAVLLN